METTLGILFIVIFLTVLLIWAYRAERNFDYGDKEPSFWHKLLFKKDLAKQKALQNSYIQENHRRFKEISSRVIEKRLKQIAIQRKKCVITDPYGKEDYTIWLRREIPYFINNHIIPELLKKNILIDETQIDSLVKEIDQKAQNYKLPKIEFDEKMGGLDFEEFCLNKLKNEGWIAKKTKSSGDQGIDIIIIKGKREIGVQCKKYSRPIGNKSVQEVTAGLKYYNLKEGVVIGNNEFTKSAIELALMNNIKLIHYMETNKI